ncbi:MAG: tetratricopeptide repeat protein [Planctomycetota bacterium]|jgi:tetratricopeptide (TPR) repeat protein
MKKIVLILTALTLSVSIAKADYISDRIEAEKLVKARKKPEAIAKFVEMAETSAKSDRQKTDAYEQAFLLSLYSKDYAKAKEYAEKIPDKSISKTAKLQIMYREKKYDDMLAFLKNENIDKWTYTHIGKAYHYKAMAQLKKNMPEEAAESLEKSVEANAGDNDAQSASLSSLASLYIKLKDNEKAKRTLEKCQKKSPYGRYTYFQSVISHADILTKEKRYDEALKKLAENKPDKAKGVWKFNTVYAVGRVYDAKGEQDKAIAEYEKAINLKGGHKTTAAKIQERIKLLKGEAKE